MEQSLVFHPVKYPAGNWSLHHLAVKDAWFTAADRTRLHGWYLAHPEPRGVALVCHGDADEVIPFEQGEELFAAAHEPKRFLRVAGGHHNDSQRDEYQVALEQFLTSLK